MQLQFRVQWNPPVKAKRIKRLHEIAVAKLGIKSAAEAKDALPPKKDETYHVDSPNRSHLVKAAPQSENAGVRAVLLLSCLLSRAVERALTRAWRDRSTSTSSTTRCCGA